MNTSIAIIGTIVITLLTNSTVVLESPDLWKGITHRVTVDNIVTQQVITTYGFYSTNYAPLLVLTNFATGPNIRTNYTTKPYVAMTNMAPVHDVTPVWFNAK